MKLEVGMYVRYKNFADISKIAKIVELKLSDNNCYENYYHFDNEDGTLEGFIKKASHNIIDLIEVGDLCIIEFYSPRYDERIERLFEVEYKEDYTIGFKNAHCNLNIFEGIWSNEDKKLKPIIKSIVTKEQFESMKYEVE